MNTDTFPASLSEIVDAVRGVIDAASREGMEGRVGFDMRVASRLLGLVQRELEQGGAHRRAEQEALCALLQVPEDRAEALRSLLCERIAAGQAAVADPALINHLWQTALNRLAIDNPGYRY